MIQRKLFFWLERLQISRAERRSVTGFVILLTGLMLTNAFVKPVAPFGSDYYADLEQAFKQRTALLQQKQKGLMARYEGIQPQTVSLDTLPTTAIRNKTALNKRININTATAVMLDVLPGIGPAYAQNIIDYRMKNGPFTLKKELMQVKGIGEARFARIKPLIIIGEINQEAMPEKSFTDSLSQMKHSAKAADKPVAIKTINVNTAGAELLETLPGIGPSYARRIIDYRLKNGPFSNINELLNIKGIGKKRLAKLKPFIQLTGDTLKQ